MAIGCFLSIRSVLLRFSKYPVSHGVEEQGKGENYADYEQYLIETKRKWSPHGVMLDVRAELG